MKQKGYIFQKRGNWCIRWREKVDGQEGQKQKYKLRCQILGRVTEEHLRNRDRKTRKVRRPEEIIESAERLMEAVNGKTIKKTLPEVDALVVQLAGALVRQNPDAAQGLSRSGNPSAFNVAEKLLGIIAKNSDRSTLMTFGELVEDKYFPEMKDQLKPSTFREYGKTWRCNLKARIENRIVNDFSKTDAFALFSQIHKDKPNLRIAPMYNIRFFLGSVFQFAEARGYFEGVIPTRVKLPAGILRGNPTEAYSKEEVENMIPVFDSPLTQAAVSLAFYSGSRKSEIEGMRWEDYERVWLLNKETGKSEHGGVIHVQRAVVNGKVGTTKTASSADDVFIPERCCALLEAYRQSIHGPTEGYILGYSATRPIDLDCLSRSKIMPVLNRCVVCDKAKRRHKKADHEFKRNESLPRWKGYHAFRRGNATHLAKNHTGNGAEAARLQLRHSDVATTVTHYIKDTKQERRASQAAQAAAQAIKNQEQRKSNAVVLAGDYVN
jgi:integrase